MENADRGEQHAAVSVLFNEPKLLKCIRSFSVRAPAIRFSALQRAEIAEINSAPQAHPWARGFSALQRAEIAEILRLRNERGKGLCFSALQRAEIAEILKIENTLTISLMFQCSSTSRNC